MWTFISTGHLASCSASRSTHTTACQGSCEGSLFLAVGLLAFLAGFIETALGLVGSAFAFSEGLHSIADGSADFYGKRIARLAREDPVRDAEIRRKGSFVIAGLLLLAALPIPWEVWRRFVGDEEPLASLMVFAGIAAITINASRWAWLSRAQRHGPTSTREDLIDHAKSDTWHGAYLFIAGGILLNYADEWSKSTQFLVDSVLSSVVFCYILWRAWSIVRRHGGHDHAH